MLNPDCWLWSGPVAGPLDMSRNHVFRTLEPFKTNHGSGAALRFAALYAAMGERVDLLPINGLFGQLHARSHRDANPRIRNVLCKLCGVQPMHNPPRLPAEQHQFFSGAEARSFVAGYKPIIKLVGAKRRNGFDRAFPYTIAAIGQRVANFPHRPFVILARSNRDLFSIGLALFVFPEEPINGPDPRRLEARNRQALAGVVPFVK